MAGIPKSVLITGASSGIGEALALRYAAPGMHLALGGRDAGRLELVAERCRARGAVVLTRAVAVTDSEAMARFVADADAAAPLDLVIANAGISFGLKQIEDLPTQVRDTFDVNVSGVFNTVHPALEHMLPRRRGQIAIMSSLAGFRSLPGSIAYSASKAAVRAYGEALRGALARHNIGVSVISPGFVRTGMTARNPFPMPLLMDADRAASIIRHGLQRNRGRIAFPLPMYLLVRSMGLLPQRLVDALIRRLPGK